jgi:transcriptional regulator with GAF, ATPase, and Fis domain
MVLQANPYSENLFKIANAVNCCHSGSEIVQSIAEKASRAMGCKGCTLMIMTPATKTLLNVATYGLSDWFVQRGRFTVNVDTSMEDTLAGNPVTILDAATDDRVLYRKQLAQEGIVSLLSVPIMLREEVVGILRLYSATPREFKDEDTKFATMVANFGAIALETAGCYQKFQKDYDCLRQDLQQVRAEVGYEGMAEPSVMPFETEYPELRPPFD